LLLSYPDWILYAGRSTPQTLVTPRCSSTYYGGIYFLNTIRNPFRSALGQISFISGAIHFSFSAFNGERASKLLYAVVTSYKKFMIFDTEFEIMKGE
jgi:hypothetical protein